MGADGSMSYGFDELQNSNEYCQVLAGCVDCEEHCRLTRSLLSKTSEAAAVCQMMDDGGRQVFRAPSAGPEDI